MKHMPAFWRNALTLYFIALMLRAFYLLFFYQDPYPGLPDARGAAHSNLNNLFASGLKFFIYGYFLSRLWIERQYGMSTDQYAGFKVWLMIYWAFMGILSLAFYLIVSLINESLSGGDHAISWSLVLIKSAEIYFLWFVLFKVGDSSSIRWKFH